ncbi:hypothetical protein M2160_004503 [Streptomyces sp. SAI-117]|uniref:DUF4145 domain-containing protein n=1 Tax=Streptomyces sp. SAI-117 TaxID=2940546 RepID=UPI00247425D0|nr:DUF4145 domain-containing protein [Streptomyces sp. SAI-117]MDH6569482.1 hypothetical protein [Streptomyces sp. SAI-117]
MTDQEEITSIRRRRAVCPHPDCATGTVMDLVDLRMIAPESREYTWTDLDSGEGFLKTYPHQNWTQQECWICQLCGRSILEVIECKGTLHTPEELTRLLLWPSPPPRVLHQDVPERIRSAYEEASRAENAGSPRLAGVGFRSAVEELCKDQGATQHTLHGKIQELAAKGLPPDVITALDETRIVGNDSVHHGVEYSAEELADVAELVAEATVILYVQPAQRRRMAESRKLRHEAAKATP